MSLRVKTVILFYFIWVFILLVMVSFVVTGKSVIYAITAN